MSYKIISQFIKDIFQPNSNSALYVDRSVIPIIKDILTEGDKNPKKFFKLFPEKDQV